MKRFRFFLLGALLLAGWLLWRDWASPSAPTAVAPPAKAAAPRVAIPPPARPASVGQSRPAPPAVPSPEPTPETPAVFSREEAKRYLDRIVAQIYPAGATLPKLDFQPEDTASAEERRMILEARQASAKAGRLLIVVRIEDSRLHFFEGGGDFPRDFVPAHIRVNLTEEDWEAFQVQMTVASVVKGLRRR
ncbi:MAG: hypothetical protein NTV51_22295 [Verrucomicrobia bacterium]|nr:hypothetical protein [Verrucomicrobiota bacterium]